MAFVLVFQNLYLQTTAPNDIVELCSKVDSLCYSILGPVVTSRSASILLLCDISLLLIGFIVYVLIFFRLPVSSFLPPVSDAPSTSTPLLLSDDDEDDALTPDDDDDDDGYDSDMVVDGKIPHPKFPRRRWSSSVAANVQPIVERAAQSLDDDTTEIGNRQMMEQIRRSHLSAQSLASSLFSFALFLLFLLLLSPLFASLTITFSSDTITALVLCLVCAHLLAFDYDFINDTSGGVTRQPHNTLSLNAFLFASTLLSSRLTATLSSDINQLAPDSPVSLLSLPCCSVLLLSTLCSVHLPLLCRMIRVRCCVSCTFSPPRFFQLYSMTAHVIFSVMLFVLVLIQLFLINMVRLLGGVVA